MVDHPFAAFTYRQENTGQVYIDDLLKLVQGHLVRDFAGFTVRRYHHTIHDDAGKGCYHVDLAKCLDISDTLSPLPYD